MTASIAVIPARGGSRRVPRKNIRPFLGVPAIEAVLATLQGSGVTDRIVVSTDDDEIAACAERAGAEVPTLRPTRLSDDRTPTIDVVRHALSTWCTTSASTTEVWVVYPTALLLQGEDLRLAQERFRASSPEFLVSLLRFPHPVERRMQVLPNGVIRMVDPSEASARTQDLEPTFHDAGQFYVGSIASWLASSPLESHGAIGYELPRTSVVDIDDVQDWELAEALARARNPAQRDPADPGG